MKTGIADQTTGEKKSAHAGCQRDSNPHAHVAAGIRLYLNIDTRP